MARFNNLTLFRFPEMPALSAEVLNVALGQRRARSCGPLELCTLGFQSVLGSHEDDIVMRRPSGALLFEVVGEEKHLPKAILEKRIQAAITQRERELGRTAYRAEKAELRNRMTSELTAVALPRPYSVHCMIDLRTGWLAIGAQSGVRAEAIVSAMREQLTSFPARPVTPKISVQAELTRWLREGQAPAPFLLGVDCDLNHPEDSTRSWRGRNAELLSEEVATHLAAQMKVTLLGLSLGEDGPRFMLDRSLRVLKLSVGEPASPDDEDEIEEMAEVNARVDGLLPILLHLERLFGLVRPAAVSMADSAASARAESSSAVLAVSYG